MEINETKTPDAREVASELFSLLDKHDNTVQNEAIEYVIKTVTSHRNRRIEQLEMEIIGLRDINHDLTTRLAYINHKNP